MTALPPSPVRICTVDKLDYYSGLIFFSLTPGSQGFLARRHQAAARRAELLYVLAYGAKN